MLSLLIIIIAIIIIASYSTLNTKDVMMRRRRRITGTSCGAPPLIDSTPDRHNNNIHIFKCDQLLRAQDTGSGWGREESSMLL